MKDRIETVADLLMGAAYADQHLAGAERLAVKQLLRNLLGGEALPMDLDFRIDEFDGATFDLQATADVFANDTPAVKRNLLELVAAIHAADQEFDIAEDEFVHRLGEALGLPHSAYKDMIISVIHEVDLAEGLDEVRFAAEDAEARPPMPPPPGSKRRS